MTQPSRRLRWGGCGGQKEGEMRSLSSLTLAPASCQEQGSFRVPECGEGSVWERVSLPRAAGGWGAHGSPARATAIQGRGRRALLGTWLLYVSLSPVNSPSSEDSDAPKCLFRRGLSLHLLMMISSPHCQLLLPPASLSPWVPVQHCYRLDYIPSKTCTCEYHLIWK